MISVSGHLRNQRREIGYVDTINPIVINSCGYMSFKTKDFTLQRIHGRLDYQIIYMHKGVGHYYLDKKWFPLTAGNIILFRPFEPQVYSYYANETPEVYWLHFTGTECEQILQKYNLKNCYIGQNLTLKLLFQEIITELQLKKLLYNDVIISDLYKIFAIISRSCQQSHLATNDNFSIDRLIIQLNQNYMKNWTIASMANFCKLSESYFSHIFKEYTHVAPMHFLNELRIENAKTLLHSTELSISVVSSLVGYEDSLYFSRVFKKFTGISPKHFQQECLLKNTPEWWDTI